ncbi:hypothetical protein ACIP9C_00920 [Lysinibacillus sp. NPDC093210]
MQEGIQEGIKTIARKMIVKGNSNKEIMELTSLAFEEIQSLRQDVE